MKQALLLSRNQGHNTPDGHRVLPFKMYKQELENRLGLQVLNIPTSSPDDRTKAIEQALNDGFSPSYILVIPHWSEDEHELCQWFDQTRIRIEQAGLTDTKLALFDTYDPTSSPHFAALEHVDLYIKGKTLAQRSNYTKLFRSGFIYADFVSDNWDFDLQGWHFGSQPSPEHIHKLVNGWNLGITPSYKRMLDWTNRVQIPWKYRPLGVHQRTGGLGNPGQQQEWYQFSRTKGIEALKPLASKYRLTRTARVSTQRYFVELCMSKAVFSPFGWGEVCFRDFEAVACGALLIKPDMSHLITEPNIYIPHETYIPIAWDYSDAVEQIDEYLSNPAKAKRIIRNAREVLREYYQSAQFVDTLGRCLGIES